MAIAVFADFRAIQDFAVYQDIPDSVDRAVIPASVLLVPELLVIAGTVDFLVTLDSVA